MANDIIKQLQSAAIPTAQYAGNVLAFPQRSAPPAKPCRKLRKGKRSNVLPFTGKTIRNINGPARLPSWKEGMVEALTKAMGQVLNGEVTGLLVVKTNGFPVEDEVMAGTVSICGTLSADLSALERQARWVEDEAHERGKDSTVRWL
jgi:hypothetical protein